MLSPVRVLSLGEIANLFPLTGHEKTSSHNTSDNMYTYLIVFIKTIALTIIVFKIHKMWKQNFFYWHWSFHYSSENYFYLGLKVYSIRRYSQEKVTGNRIVSNNSIIELCLYAGEPDLALVLCTFYT